jgi:BASS family bile acid:Na+ symporter
MPATALPCAISATFHSVIGSLLAGFWRLRPVRK